MSDLKEATSHRPFSNGTERHAWESKWCWYCAHDHSISHGYNSDGSEACDLLMLIDLDEFPERWPEAWLPEPDDGHFHLPSRMVCLRFSPCEQNGCTGDPAVEARAQRVSEVTAYWSPVSSEATQ